MILDLDFGKKNCGQREFYTPIDTTGLTPDVAQRVIKLNCLGSLYYFIKVGLRRRKLTDHLHLPVCLLLEKQHLKDVLELPRDHLKSTCCSEGRPIWRALPFGSKEEDDFRALGYSDAFIRWMRHIHNPAVRNLLVSENITNSAKLGRRIRWHYESNSTFRALFPEVLPDSSCTWGNFSLQQRGIRGPNGECTFDFLGVGGALQSRHYNGDVVQDDMVGKKARESATVMDKTIEFHQLVIGAYEDEDKDHEGDEIVVGNRWAFHDVNNWIEQNEPWFKFTSHSALGGCCDLHPAGDPIFPEVFSYEKLERIRSRLGAYFFSCQFLNKPVAPEDADFKEAWLNYYTSWQGNDGQWYIRHELKDGIVKTDFNVWKLRIAITVDPAHSGNSAGGRCRHAIMVVGQDDDGDYYLLENWARKSGYDEFYAKIFELAKKWRCRRVGFETIAAQRFAKHHIETMNYTSEWKIKIDELKGEVEGPDGELTRKKEFRIRTVLAPIFESERFWVQRRKCQDFIEEYNQFPKGRFVDQLDALAYLPQLIKRPVSDEQNLALLARNQQNMALVNAPYSHKVQ